MKLDDKSVVVITGSSIGIGRETAYKFAAEGCKVIITYYKNKKEAIETSKKCFDLGASDVLVLKLNIMDNASITDAVNKILKKYRKISVLVNNAGVITWNVLEKQSEKEIEDQLRTNLEGLIKMTKACLKHTEDVIVNIASGAGKTAYSELAVYCATKFGVRGFTQSMAEEVNKPKFFSVNPGMTATRMTNFKGVAPEEVAEVVLKTVKGEYKFKSGDDVDVWDFI